MKLTKVFSKNIKAYNQGKRTIINKGGTRSSKTFSILQLLVLIAESQNKLITIVSRTLPHLKGGIVRDLEKILIERGHNPGEIHRLSDKYFIIGNSKIEYFGADDLDRVHGPARDILYVNEANHIKYSVYNQLAVRTKEQIFIDYNPTGLFWVDEEGIINDETSEVIHSTYLDNIENLSQPQIDEILKAKEKADKGIPYYVYWWKVYGLGETGHMIERRIIKYFDIIDSVPDYANKIPSGMDFGLSPDPTTLIDIYVHGENLYLDERLYANNLINVNLGSERLSIEEKLIEIGHDKEHIIVADSAEKKSIIELRHKGFNVRSAIKYPGSIKEGLKLLLSYNIIITNRSINLKKEFENYLYKIDRNDKIIPEPIDAHNHLIDPIRYVLLMKGRLWQ